MKIDEALKEMRGVAELRIKDTEHTSRGRVLLKDEQVAVRPGSGKAYTVTETGRKNLFKFSSVSEVLANNLTHDTLGRVLNEILGKKGAYSMVMDGGAVVDFLNYGERQSIPAERALSTIERAIPGIEVSRVVLPGNHVASVEFVGIEQKPVARGDLVSAGCRFMFSPIGTIEPVVQSYVVRLACTNGMTSNHFLGNFHYGADGGDGNGGGSFWNWYKASVKKAYRALGQVIVDYQRMLRENVTPADRAELLEALIKSAGFGPEAAHAVRAAATNNPPQNSYDMMNLISWGSSHAEQDPRRLLRAQNAVAQYVDEDTHARMCPTCHRSRSH